MIALKKLMDKTIWNIKISIWQYTVCGSHEVVMKSKMTLLTFLVHMTSLVVNNSTLQVNTPGKKSAVIVFNQKRKIRFCSGMAFSLWWLQFEGLGRILLLIWHKDCSVRVHVSINLIWEYYLNSHLWAQFNEYYIFKLSI